ncbi:MAG: ligase-associated DNA damage response endonuclease PdeM [Wenzhouxiangellaceae bacterium]
MKIDLAGNPLELLPQRAVWWPAARSLVVADVHLGKDQVFRRAGIAIPSSVLEAELAGLDGLLQKLPADRLIVLGDWVHAPPIEGEDWPAAISAWRARHAQLAIELVLGNHDRDLAAWLHEWRIEGHKEGIEINGLQLSHEVVSEYPFAGMSGHLHPVAWLRAGRERLRLPAFARSGDHLILPAFGRFTGGFDGLVDPQWALYAIAGERVVELAPDKRRARPLR